MISILSFLAACSGGDIALVEDKCPASEADIFFIDADGDGYGDSNTGVAACEPPEGTTLIGGDCNDMLMMVNPGMEEVCNDVDDNCDGLIDDIGVMTGYLDSDGDGYGDVSISVESCDAPDELVDEGGDCNDDNPLINPGAFERCDEQDWDCDGDPTSAVMGSVACEVLMYEGHTAESRQVSQTDFVTFTDVLMNEGATSVEYAYDLPADLTQYRMVYVSHATQEFTAEEAQRFIDFRDAGGSLLLAAENGAWGSSMTPAYNSLLEHMGTDTRLLPDDLDGNCLDWMGTAQSNHPILDGVAEVRYAYSSNIDLGTDGEGLILGQSGQWLMAVTNDIFVFADSTIMMDNCEDALPEGNRQLYRNLFHFSPE